MAHNTHHRERMELRELLEIARLISSEKNIHHLLDLILGKSRMITNADAGSIYLVERDIQTHAPLRLHFKITQNDSRTLDFREFSMDISRQSIVGTVVLEHRSINIADLYCLQPDPSRTWHHDNRFDQHIDYRSRSMLTVPMVDQHDAVIGAIQLINRKTDRKKRLVTAKDFQDLVIPFTDHDVTLVSALAAHAGVSLETALLTEAVQQLFEGFVHAAMAAIESRDPATQGHSQRVTTLVLHLARAVNASQTPPFETISFPDDAVKTLEYASLLHDFGKIGVPEKILVKSDKLDPTDRVRIVTRLDHMRTLQHLNASHAREQLLREGPLSPEKESEIQTALSASLKEIDGMEATILSANRPSFLPETAGIHLQEISQRTFALTDGTTQPVLTPDELQTLRIQKGNLTSDERQQIERHVIHTDHFLSKIPWGRRYTRVPEIARDHHEKLDGSGYPLGKDASEIAIESRMLAICDFFDALTAADRPYKPAVPLAQALSILQRDVDEGRLDANLFRLFCEQEIYRIILEPPFTHE